ncbi:MAG: hypothetical protein AB1635_02940 [Acidobacteriota bacterium]
MTDADAYCRDIEAYLCRKNDGHLIRIVGPAFDLVRGWAAMGVPLRVACAGIDRTFERYYRKGPRRRPVRVEFCEADVLDAFDGWRRAVGVAADAEPASGVGRQASGARRGSLGAHIEQAQARLTLLRGSDRLAPTLGAALSEAVEALDRLQADARRARGEARDAIVARLAAIDAGLVAAATKAVPPEVLARLRIEAESELAPFRARMPASAAQAAGQAALDRLVRAHWQLPAIRYE